MTDENESGGCLGVIALLVIGLCVVMLIIRVAVQIITEGVPYLTHHIKDGVIRVQPTLRRLADKPTYQDLKDDYYHGMKTPRGWAAGEWYKYKTETPNKALRYLERLANSKS